MHTRWNPLESQGIDSNRPTNEASPGGCETRTTMKLTIRVEQRDDGKWVATSEEMPHISYVDADREVAVERMRKLAHALRSPHIQPEDIRQDADGGVILTISRRHGDEDEEEERPKSGDGTGEDEPRYSAAAC